MEIGKEFNNILAYNQNMAKGLEDKLFFLNHLPPDQQYIFVDFGCADGSLINYLINICDQYSNTYIGYDISDTMISLAKSSFNGNPENVLFTSDWEQVTNMLLKSNGDKKKVLILSSVIHEVYSYAHNHKDISDFWNKVTDTGFDYICVRDMMCSEDLNRPAEQSYSEKIENQNKPLTTLHARNEFIQRWGPFTNMKNIVHYLLKYRWTINWERELNENYFPLTIEDFVKETTKGKYDLTYLERFRVPYLDECFKRDWDITLKDYTHVKAIFEINKHFLSKQKTTMYVLIKQCGDDSSVVAVSESKNLVRQKLVREAKRILNDYLDPGDPHDQKKKNELFRSLNEIGDRTQWDDGDEACLLSFRIESAPLINVK